MKTIYTPILSILAITFSLGAISENFVISDSDFDRIVSEINNLDSDQLQERRVVLMSEAQNLEDEKMEMFLLLQQERL